MRRSTQWLLLIAVSAGSALVPSGAKGQAHPDSVALDSARVTPPDSISTEGLAADSTVIGGSDSLTAAPVTPVSHPFQDQAYVAGVPVDSVLYAQGYYLDMTAEMADVPGAFSYTLANLGWAHQWAYLAMPPSMVELTVDGTTARDPVTNRALFDVLQVDLLESQRASFIAHGGPVLLESRTRPFDYHQPYTELRYERGGAGLQFISASHVQQREWRLLGAPTVTQFLARFSFHEWEGKYPNSHSDLSQVYSRVGFTSRRWRVRISDTYTLRNRGAHSGVIPKSASDLDSVYEIFGATVGDPQARQKLRRNELGISLEHTWLSDIEPLAIWTSWTRFHYQYIDGDTLASRSSEVRLNLAQQIPTFIRGHAITGRFSFESVDIKSDSLLTGGGGSVRSRLIASLDDRFVLGSTDASLFFGVHAVDEWLFPTAGISLTRPVASLILSAEGSLHGRAPSPLEQSGGVGVIAEVQGLQPTQSTNARLSVTAPGSRWSAKLAVFYTGLIDPIEIVRQSEGRYRVEQLGDYSWAGAVASIGWRANTRRGFYGLLSPTVQTTLGNDVAGGIDASLPHLFASARFGFRNQVFAGDLDMDLYLLGRYWSEFRSRVFDPVQSILVLPEDGADTFGQSGTLDVRFEGGIRGARIFLSLDNVLADFLYPGALVVPIYPIPAQNFRFGVYWPIDG